MKIGDKIIITKNIRQDESSPIIVKKGEIHIIKSFETYPPGSITISSGTFKIWRNEFELITANHPHTDAFK